MDEKFEGRTTKLTPEISTARLQSLKYEVREIDEKRLLTFSGKSE